MICRVNNNYVMANPFLRLASSLACVPGKLAVGRKKEIVLAHIVGEVPTF